MESEYSRALRARNVDVLTAAEAEMLGVPDSVQLAFATSDRRTLFTFNTRDFAQQLGSASRHIPSGCSRLLRRLWGGTAEKATIALSRVD